MGPNGPARDQKWALSLPSQPMVTPQIPADLPPSSHFWPLLGPHFGVFRSLSGRFPSPRAAHLAPPHMDLNFTLVPRSFSFFFLSFFPIDPPPTIQSPWKRSIYPPTPERSRMPTTKPSKAMVPPPLSCTPSRTRCWT